VGRAAAAGAASDHRGGAARGDPRDGARDPGAACDDEVIPLQGRIEHVADEADLEEVYSTERHLLYVACTRARDRLLVTGVEPASEFVDHLRG